MQITSNIISQRTIKRVIITATLLIMATAGVFGQTKSTSKDALEIVSNNTNVEAQVSVADAIAASESDIDFMNWFMGTKQSQNSRTEEAVKTTTNTKKQMIISGGTPNRVLYRTFMKKVISIENALV